MASLILHRSLVISWERSIRIKRLGSFSRDRSIGIIHSNTFAWDSSFGIFRLGALTFYAFVSHLSSGSVPWDRSLLIFGWDLPLAKLAGSLGFGRLACFVVG